MRIGVVIANYYPERQKNIPAVVAALQAQTRPPDSILLWNNGPGLAKPEGVQLVETDRNYGCGAMYVGALLTPCDWLLIQGNDVALESWALERALLLTDGSGFFGAAGVTLGAAPVPYSGGRVVQGGRSAEHVDVVVGRVSLMPYALACKVAALSLAEQDLFRCDDIVASSLSRNCWSVEIPHRALSEEGVGLSWAPEHYPQRDRAAKRWFGL